MSVIVKTNNPTALVQSIKDKIYEGKIDTWSVDEEGDFTHSADQWRFHAWMHPVIEINQVVFSIIGRKDTNLSVVDYAIYHGRFIEMLLTHFDKSCTEIKATPLASSYDYISSNNG